MRPPGLPDFRDPPVSEVVLSMQFDQLAQFQSRHIGLLWQKFSASYPNVFEHPRLPPAFETFGPQNPINMFNLFAGLNLGQTPRQWFVSASGADLLQFQTDRFTHNWRKVSVAERYPRYETIRDVFLREVGILEAFLAEMNLPALVPNQCEVSYVNDIPLDSFSDPTAEIFRVWQSPSSELLGPVEDVGFVVRFIIRRDQGPLGRLIVQSGPANNLEGHPVIRLQLTARGAPLEPTIKGVLDFFDLGRQFIVQGFADLTTDQMHKNWGRVP